MFEIYQTCRTLLKMFLPRALSTAFQEQSLEFKMMGDSLKLLDLVITFPYMLSVNEFHNENRIEDIVAIIFPPTFQDKFIDMELFELLMKSLTSGIFPSSQKCSILSIIARLPCVPTSICSSTVELDNYLRFFLKTFIQILELNNDDSSCCFVVDYVARLLMLFSIDQILNMDLGEQFIVSFEDWVLKKVVSGRRFKVGGEIAEQLNTIILFFINHTVNKNHEFSKNVVIDVVKGYCEQFMHGGWNNQGLGFADELLEHQIEDYEQKMEESFKIFEESYHYFDEVKEYVLNILSVRIFRELGYFVDNWQQNVSNLPREVGRLINFMLICTSGFLSFQNMNSEVDYGFTSLAMHRMGSSSRQAFCSKEGEVLGRLFTLFNSLEVIFSSKAMKTSENDPLITHFNLAYLYLVKKSFSAIKIELGHASLSDYETNPELPLFFSESQMISNIVATQNCTQNNLEEFFIYFAKVAFLKLSSPTELVYIFSLKLLKVISTVKNQLCRQRFQQSRLLKEVTDLIFAFIQQANSKGTERSFYIRKYLFTIVTTWYMCDHMDDYIQNAWQISDKIFATVSEQPQNLPPQALLGIFTDLSGIFSSNMMSEVLNSFLRVV